MPRLRQEVVEMIAECIIKNLPNGATLPANATNAAAKFAVWAISHGWNPAVLLCQPGDAMSYMKIIAESSNRKVTDILEEKIKPIEDLDNTGDQYYSGKLRNSKGQIDLRSVQFTPLGKGQLLLNGNGPLEIALRDASVKGYIVNSAINDLEVCNKAANEIADKKRKCLIENKNAWKVRNQTAYNQMGMDANKAQGAGANSDKILYKAFTQGNTTAQQAVQMGKRNATEAELDNPTPDLARKVRNTRVSKEGTNYFYQATAMLRIQAEFVSQHSNLPIAVASQLVAKDAKEKGSYLVKEQDPQDENRLVPRPQQEQVHCSNAKQDPLKGTFLH